MFKTALKAASLVAIGIVVAILGSVVLAGVIATSPLLDVSTQAYQDGLLPATSVFAMLRIQDLIVFALYTLAMLPIAQILRRLYRELRPLMAAGCLFAGALLVWGPYAAWSLGGVLQTPFAIASWVGLFGTAVLVAALPAWYLVLGRVRRTGGNAPITA